jgi:hypothetical protein
MEMVKLVDGFGALEWRAPSGRGADFDPETLRNWPAYKDEIIAERQRRYTVAA